MADKQDDKAEPEADPPATTISLVPDVGPPKSPTVVWVSKAAAGNGCDSCLEKEGWFALIEDTLTLCGKCAHVLLAKLLKFHIRLVDGRQSVEGIDIPPFTKPLRKEKEVVILSD